MAVISYDTGDAEEKECLLLQGMGDGIQLGSSGWLQVLFNGRTWSAPLSW